MAPSYPRRYLASLLALITGLVVSSGSAATSDALHPKRFLLLDSKPSSSSSSGLRTSSTLVIEPSRRFLTDVESTLSREIRGLKTASSSSSATNLRTLQAEELTFEEVCSFLVEIVNEGSEGAIACACEAESNLLSCLTPTPICENTLTNICASLSLNITFLDNFGSDTMGVCVNYTGVSDPSGPFRDGCVSADFAGDGTSIQTCVAQFDDESGVRTDCTTCAGCGNATIGGGFSLDCSNLYPGATTNGCYSPGATAEQASALFPGAENGGGAGNGTVTGGDEGEDGGDGNDGGGPTTGNGTATGGGNDGEGEGGDSDGNGNGGGPTTGNGNGTMTDDVTDGDTEDDAEGDGGSGTGAGGTGTNGTADAATGTSSGPRPSRASAGALTAAGVVVASLVGMLATP